MEGIHRSSTNSTFVQYNKQWTCANNRVRVCVCSSIRYVSEVTEHVCGSQHKVLTIYTDLILYIQAAKWFANNRQNSVSSSKLFGCPNITIEANEWLLFDVSKLFNLWFLQFSSIYCLVRTNLSASQTKVFRPNATHNGKSTNILHYALCNDIKLVW